jgi:hypothetical protein
MTLAPVRRWSLAGAPQVPELVVGACRCPQHLVEVRVPLVQAQHVADVQAQ